MPYQAPPYVPYDSDIPEVNTVARLNQMPDAQSENAKRQATLESFKRINDPATGVHYSTSDPNATPVSNQTPMSQLTSDAAKAVGNYFWEGYKQPIEETMGVLYGKPFPSMDSITGAVLNAPQIGMVKASHGTPRRQIFDAFDPAKIGSGEGGAARGWGFYLSDAGYKEGTHDVAKVYAMREQGYPKIEFRGMTYSSPSSFIRELEAKPELISKGAFDQLKDTLGHGMDIDAVKQVLELRRKNVQNLTEKMPGYNGRLKTNPAHIDEALAVLNDAKLLPPQAGYIYDVTINPGKVNDNWLDWDAPVTEQHFKTIEAQMEKEKGFAPDLDSRGMISKGGDLYRALGQVYGSKRAVSEFLDRAGIDGIRFEAGSIMGIKPRVTDAKIAGLTDEQLMSVLTDDLHLSPNEISKYWGETPQEIRSWLTKEAGRFQANNLFNAATKRGFIPTEYNYVIFNPNKLKINAIHDTQGNIVKKFHDLAEATSGTAK